MERKSDNLSIYEKRWSCDKSILKEKRRVNRDESASEQPMRSDELMENWKNHQKNLQKNA